MSRTGWTLALYCCSNNKSGSKVNVQRGVSRTLNLFVFKGHYVISFLCQIRTFLSSKPLSAPSLILNSYTPVWTTVLTDLWEWLITTPRVLVLIQRENGSMEKELEELRRSRPKPQDGGDFTLSDCFYFTRRGVESIVEDEVQYWSTGSNVVGHNIIICS